MWPYDQHQRKLVDNSLLYVQRFAAQKGRPRGDLPALIHNLGLNQNVLNQQWTELSVCTRFSYI